MNGEHWYFVSSAIVFRGSCASVEWFDAPAVVILAVQVFFVLSLLLGAWLAENWSRR